MRHIEAITLDLDDTLWPVAPVIARAEERLRDWLGATYPRIVAEFSLEAARTLREAVTREHGERAHDLAFLRRETLRRMGERAGYGSIDVEAAAAAFDAARNEVDFYPDVPRALESLAARYRLVAVTNGTADLERVGLGQYFEACVNAMTAGAPKPSRRIFAAAVAAADAPPERVLHAGDQPHLDIEGARAAGLATAWINRAGAAWPPELALPQAEVADLAELDALLRSPGGEAGG